MNDNNGAENFYDKLAVEDYFSFNLKDKGNFNTSNNINIETDASNNTKIIKNLIEQLNDYKLKYEALLEENLALKQRLNESNINFIIPENLKNTDNESTTKKLSYISIEKNKFVYKKTKESNYCNIYKEKKKNSINK